MGIQVRLHTHKTKVDPLVTTEPECVSINIQNNPYKNELISMKSKDISFIWN